MGMRSASFSWTDVFLTNIGMWADYFFEKNRKKRDLMDFFSLQYSNVLTDLTLFEPNMGMTARVFHEKFEKNDMRVVNSARVIRFFLPLEWSLVSKIKLLKSRNLIFRLKLCDLRSTRVITSKWFQNVDFGNLITLAEFTFIRSICKQYKIPPVSY